MRKVDFTSPFHEAGFFFLGQEEWLIYGCYLKTQSSLYSVMMGQCTSLIKVLYLHCFKNFIQYENIKLKLFTLQ